MIKRYYVQDYPQTFRGNSEARTITSNFTCRQWRAGERKKRIYTPDMWWGQVAD